MPSRSAIGRILAIALTAFGTRVIAAVGDLDSSFGVGGKVVSQLGLAAAPFSIAAGAVRQPDGRLVVAGVSSDAFGRRALTLARYSPDGAFDPSFGPGASGVVRTQLGAGPTPSVGLTNNPIARAPDGSLVVCGEASDAAGHTQILVARYTEAGMLDPSFGSGGKFVLQLLIGSSGGSGLLGCSVQPDGRVVGAGYRFNGTGIDAVVLRLDTHGVLDPGFASGGVLVQNLALGSAMYSDASDVLVLPTESIIPAVEGKDGSNANGMGVGRLTTSGMFDPGFGISGGYTLLPIGGNAFGSAVARQADGRLVVGGSASDAMGHLAMLATRFTANGEPDPSFGNGGSMIVQPSAAATPQSGALAIVQQPSGKTILVGDADDTVGGRQLAIARLMIDGSLDPSFGGTGIVLEQFAGGLNAQTYGESALFTPDGKLVVSGHADGGGTSAWFVASFIADLPPEPSFGIAPAAPAVGDTITLDASTSRDPDGQVTDVSWDLDGDGAYGDATGATATVSFGAAGRHTIGVAVTDDDGVSATITQAVDVVCGTAASALSIDCRLGALVASVDGGISAGKTHDRLTAALAKARALVAQAAAATGKPARKAVAKAARALRRFAGAVRAAGHNVSRDLRGELLASAKAVRAAIKQLPRR
jgi:uncharacterized delta-60 repeat protein